MTDRQLEASIMQSFWHRSEENVKIDMLHAVEDMLGF